MHRLSSAHRNETPRQALTEEANYSKSLVVRRAISQLSETLRTSILLHYVGGYSITEVTDLVNVPAKTVSRCLMAAKQKLRVDLLPEILTQLFMPEKTNSWSPDRVSLIAAMYPNSKILSVQEITEPRMPFASRVNLSLSIGEATTFDVRYDLTPERAELLRVLATNGITGPQLIFGPKRTSDDAEWMSHTEVPRGGNLLLWALGGTRHRIRLATERAYQAINKLGKSRSYWNALRGWVDQAVCWL